MTYTPNREEPIDRIKSGTPNSISVRKKWLNHSKIINAKDSTSKQI